MVPPGICTGGVCSRLAAGTRAAATFFHPFSEHNHSERFPAVVGSLTHFSVGKERRESGGGGGGGRE